MNEFVKIEDEQPKIGADIIVLKPGYYGSNPVTFKDCHYSILNYCFTDLKTAIDDGVVYWQPMLKLPKGVV